MSFFLSADRHFSVSAFGALIPLRRYVATYGVDVVDAASTLSKIDAGYAASDIEAGLSLDRLLPSEISFEDYATGLQRALLFLVSFHRPWWRVLFPAGRKRVLDGLSPSERQLFDHAGLSSESPSDDIRQWWYVIQSEVRGEQDARQSAQGGKAERLSFEFEKKRLKALGIDLQPEWTGFDTNGLGYDVKSYDPGPYGPRVKLIEVKSSTSEPPRIILSRNEWKSAKKYGDAFAFHLWLLPEEDLRQLTVAEVELHVPSNHGAGEWMDVEIIFHS